MIDTHVHLDLYPNALDIVHETNIKNIFTLSVTTSPRAWKETARIFAPYKNIRVGLGLHPELVAQRSSELNLFLEWMNDVEYIGEVGLDGSPSCRQGFSQQLSVFKSILQQADSLGGKTLSVHSRNAAELVLDSLSRYSKKGRIILHWFTGSYETLHRAIQLGCLFSLGPASLSSERGRSILSHIPLTKILPESDGPFVQLKKNTIMPWEAISISQYLGQIHHISPKEVLDRFRENMHREGLLSLHNQ